MVKCSESRQAAHNRSEAVSKLHELIAQTVDGCIITPASQEQKAKVRSLKKKEDLKRKDMKMKRGDKKTSRGKVTF